MLYIIGDLSNRI